MASLLVCEPCGKRFNGKAPYLDHIQSEKHMKKVKMLQMASQNGTTELNCIIQTSSKDGSSTPVPSLPTVIYTEAGVPPTFACGPCGKTFSGNIPYEDHMRSANHRKKLESLNFLKSMQKGNQDRIQPKRIEIPIEKLSCSACGIKFTTLEATLEHYESDSHRSKKQFSMVLGKLSSGSERSSPVDEVDMAELETPTTNEEVNGCNDTNKLQHTLSLKLKIADISTKANKAVDLTIIEGDDDEVAKKVEAAIWEPRSENSNA